MHVSSSVYVVLIAVTMFAGSVIAKPSVPEKLDRETLAKINAIENGLIPPFVTTLTKRETIAARMKHYQVPAVSIALINNGKIEWVRAYGVRDATTRVRATPDTLFQAASISKPVSALGALLLVEDGTLNLDENVNTKLTSWKLPENEFTQKTPVSLRALLSHTAGTTVHGFDGYPIGAPLPSVPQILEGLPPANSAAVRVDITPRTLWRYSGGGTTIVQQLVADVAGTPFAAYMRDRVLVPAGMSRSAYEQPLSPARAVNAASGHEGGKPISGKWHVYPELAAAGLWTTPRDLAKLAIAVQRAAQGQQQGQQQGQGGQSAWLKQSTAQLLVTEQTAESNGARPWTIGFGLDKSGGGNPRFMHGGANKGFQCNLIHYIGEGKGIVVMTNSGNGTPLIEEIQRAAATVYGWKELAPPVYDVVTLAPAELQTFVGEYEGEGEGSVAISILRDGDQLVGRAAQLGWDRLHALGSATFITEVNQLTIEFSADENGKLNAIIVTTPQGAMRASRRNDKAFRFAQEPFYLRGSMNEWGTVNEMKLNAESLYVTELDINPGEYQFKFGSGDFRMIDFGSAKRDVVAKIGDTLPLALVGSNLKLSVPKKARYVFEMDVKNPLAPTMRVTARRN